MPITPTEKIWMDGELVDWADAKVHVLTHTMHYGSGVFEGIRAYGTSNGVAVFRLREHIERLFTSAKVFLIDVPYSVEQIVEAYGDDNFFIGTDFPHPEFQFLPNATTDISDKPGLSEEAKRKILGGNLARALKL